MALLMEELNRRGVTALAMALGTGVIVRAGGGFIHAAAAETESDKRGQPSKGAGNDHNNDNGGEGGEDVSATEDLMREHGVLRRTLIVYFELSTRLRSGSGLLDPGALAEAAKLFHEFGEEYHEKMLEEVYIFPEVRKAGGPNEKLIEVLLIQHRRGREITDYLSRVGKRGNVGGNAMPLANALSAMTRMYQAHSAWEDTVVFPAWKKTQSKARLDDLAEKFEDIEHQQFGKDGFDDAVSRISHVEKLLGLDDLAVYTPEPLKP